MSNKANHPLSMDEIVARLRGRQRLLHVLLRSGQGVFYGGILAAMVAAVGAVSGAEWMRVNPWIVLLCIPGLAVIGGLVGLLQRVDSLRVARAMDRAAAGEDRFASALQLAGHHRRSRARLVVEDALSAVSGTPTETALPMRAPRELKWLPLPAVALAVLFWLAPGASLDAQVADQPEVSADEWASVHDEFRRQLDELPEPKTPEQEETAKELEKLASLLQKQPDKKEVLAQIAKLRSKLEQRRKNLSTRDLSMRKAARAMRSSKALSRTASKLRQGEYGKAADELRALAAKLRENTERLSASDFEAAAEDFDRLASELASNDELSQACRNCANAASSMNREKFAESLCKWANALDKNLDDLEECDGLCRCRSMLDDLLERLNGYKKCKQCNGNCNGKCSGSGAFVKYSNKKGGLKAGWGTATSWRDGSLSDQKGQRAPKLAATREGPGTSTSFSVVSKEERAASGQDYKDLYAEMVQKAEADLSLEAVPVAYRDFLRRYFLAIRPQEAAAESEGEE